MLNVGLTGGIASGKSTVARMLVENGGVLVDLDALVHAAEAPEGPAWQRIVSHFGDGILLPDRTIDRRKLGKIVFEDREKLALLNSVVHPVVIEAWQRRLLEIRNAQANAVIISDVPLLIEKGMGTMVDLVLLVYIPPEEQIRRLMARDGFSRHDAECRLASQMPIDEKIPHADFIIRNDGPLEATEQAVGALWKELQRRNIAACPKSADTG